MSVVSVQCPRRRSVIATGAIAASLVALEIVGAASAQRASRIVVEGVAAPFSIRPRDVTHSDSSYCGGARPPPCLVHVSSMSFRGVARHGAVRAIEVTVSSTGIGPTRIDLAAVPGGFERPGGCGRTWITIEDASGASRVARSGWVEVRQWTRTRTSGVFEAHLEGANLEGANPEGASPDVVRGSFDVALPRPPRQPACPSGLP